MRRTVLTILAVVAEAIAGVVLHQVNPFLGSVLIGNAFGNVLLVALTY
jgi:hypothetical protein